MQGEWNNGPIKLMDQNVERYKPFCTSVQWMQGRDDNVAVRMTLLIKNSSGELNKMAIEATGKRDISAVAA